MNSGRASGVFARILVVAWLILAPSGCKDADTITGVQSPPTAPSPAPQPTPTPGPHSLRGMWTGVFRDDLGEHNFVTSVSHGYGEVGFSFEVVWRFNGFIMSSSQPARVFGQLRRDGHPVASLSGEASTRRIALSGSQYSITLSRP